MVAKQNWLEYWVDPKTWRFRGNFEGMYRDFDDPWECKKNVSELRRDILLMMLFRNRRFFPRILDIGCGLGAFTERLRVTNAGGEVLGIDVSETAVQKARKHFGECQFEVMDITQEPLLSGKMKFGWDLIVLSEVIWYVLPSLSDLLCRLHSALSPTGTLCIQQFFPKDQKYGLQYLTSSQELYSRYLQPAGFQREHEWVELLDNGAVNLILLNVVSEER